MNNTNWESWGITHIGRVRTINQDAFLELPGQQFWLVADGMGGHTRGEFASAAIVSALKNFTQAPTLDVTVLKIKETLQQVGQTLFQLGKKAGDSTVIGSTVAILLAYRDTCVILWSGDSRIYLFRNGTLTQLTVDHNYEGFLIENGISTEQAQAHPLAQSLTHAIGSDETVFLETRIRESQEQDIFLLCSDGLNKEVSDREIEEVLQNLALPAASQKLMEMCLSRNCRDNVTIVLAYCKGDATIPYLLVPQD